MLDRYYRRLFSSAVPIPLRHPYSDLWRGAAVLSFIDALPWHDRHVAGL